MDRSERKALKEIEKLQSEVDLPRAASLFARLVLSGAEWKTIWIFIKGHFHARKTVMGLKRHEVTYESWLELISLRGKWIFYYLSGAIAAVVFIFGYEIGLLAR